MSNKKFMTAAEAKAKRLENKQNDNDERINFIINRLIIYDNVYIDFLNDHQVKILKELGYEVSLQSHAANDDISSLHRIGLPDDES